MACPAGRCGLLSRTEGRSAMPNACPRDCTRLPALLVCTGLRPAPPSRRSWRSPRAAGTDGARAAGRAAAEAPDDARAFARRESSAAWAARDVAALAGAVGPRRRGGARPPRRTIARAAFAARRDGAHARSRRPATSPDGRHALTREVQVFAAEEPRARVGVLAAARPSGARRAGRSSRARTAGQVDGLVHLSLGPRGVAGARRLAPARGLRAAHGGRHALLDPGGRSGRRRSSSSGAPASASSPRPAAEREQLRQLLGRARRSTRASAGRSCACTPRTSGGCSRPAGWQPETDPERTARRGGARLPRARRRAASSSTRRCPARPGG